MNFQVGREKHSTRTRLPHAMTILLFSPSLENLNTTSKSKYQMGNSNNEVCSPIWTNKLNNDIFHHDKYVTAKFGAAWRESLGNPWDWKLTAQEWACCSALAIDFWSGAPITDMGESPILRPGENVPQCPFKPVMTHRWKMQSVSASISSKTRAPAARRTQRMFLWYFPKPGDVTVGPGWIPLLLQARTGNISPQSSLQKPLVHSTQTPSSSPARERSSPLKS